MVLNNPAVITFLIKLLVRVVLITLFIGLLLGIRVFALFTTSLRIDRQGLSPGAWVMRELLMGPLNFLVLRKLDREKKKHEITLPMPLPPPTNNSGE